MVEIQNALYRMELLITYKKPKNCCLIPIHNIVWLCAGVWSAGLSFFFHVHSNSVRTPDYYSWSRMKHLGATVFKWESQDMVGQMDKWLNMPAKRIYCKKYVLQGNFFTSLYTKYKARKDEMNIFSNASEVDWWWEHFCRRLSIQSHISSSSI